MWLTRTKPPPLGLQLGEVGQHGGGSPPSAKAPIEHVPTSIAVARTSLIIRFTIFLRCVIRTGVSFVADGRAGPPTQNLFSASGAKQKAISVGKRRSL